jgi:group I intron endonuclease
MRFLEYFNTSYLLRNPSMMICRAMLKHGYSNFSLTILEYCEPDKCLEREGYYLKLFKPEYNIAQDPTAPMSGRTHSNASRTIMSEAKKGENNPNYGKNHSGENNPMFGKNHSDDTKKKISDALVGNANKKGKPKSEGAGRPSQAIEVVDIKNNITTSYDSIREAARTLNIRKSVISEYFSRNQQKPYKGIYTFNKK